MGYRDYEIYKELENLIKSAGVGIVYQSVPDDRIDGEIWARADIKLGIIMMPDTEAFPDYDTACLILGHEMGHILSGLDSSDIPDVRRNNEAVCDQVGVYLYRLAERIAERKAEEFYKANGDPE